MEKTIANNIREARLAQGHSQEYAAELCKMSARHFARIERGEANPTLKTLENIVAGLELTWFQLLDEHSEKESM